MRRWLPLAGGVLAGVVVLAYVRGPGVDLSPDSVSYLAAADQIVAGHGPRDFQGDPLVLWPPLYPAVLAAFSRVGGGVLAAGAAVNALAQALTTALVVLWWRRLGVSTALLAAGAVILAMNRVTLHTAGYLWSEPLHGLLGLAAVAAVALPPGPVTTRRAILAGALAGAAWLTKYLGVSVAAVVVVAVVVRGAPRRAWLLAALCAALPAGAWLLRNLETTGTLTGPRLPGPGFSFGMLVEAWRVLSRVFLSGVLAAPLVAVLVAAGLRTVFGQLPPGAYSRRAALTVGGLLVAHTAFLTFAVSTVAMDGIGRRFMAPTVAPAIFLAILLLDRQRRLPRLARVVPALGLMLAVYPALSGLALLREGRPLTPGDRPAPTLAASGGTWFSNDPLQVYRWYRHPVRHAPAWQRHPTVAQHTTPDRWADLLRAEGGEGWLLWVGPRDEARLAELQAAAGLNWQQTSADDDLTVFHLRL